MTENTITRLIRKVDAFEQLLRDRGPRPSLRRRIWHYRLSLFLHLMAETAEQRRARLAKYRQAGQTAAITAYVEQQLKEALNDFIQPIEPAIVILRLPVELNPKPISTLIMLNAWPVKMEFGQWGDNHPCQR